MTIMRIYDCELYHSSIDKALNNRLNLTHQELISYSLTFNSNDLKHLDYLKNKSFFSKKKFKLINK